MPFLAVEDAELYYEMHGPQPGAAPAIVFAHGLGGNHLSWWQQVPQFRDRYTCIVFDHRGFALSREATGGPGASAFADDLRALLDQLGIERASLVAQSMGGWTCLRFAVRHPARVERLVMCDTHGGIDTPEIRAAWARARELAATLPAGAHPAAGRRMFREQPDLHFLYTEINDLTPPRTPDEMRDLMRAAGTLSPDEVATLDVPVLSIAGEEDVVIPPDVIEIARTYVRDARIERVPEAGHSVYFERAARFNEIVDGFLVAKS